jgi:hypothetical protein
MRPYCLNSTSICASTCAFIYECMKICTLKGLSHEIFTVIFLAWMDLYRPERYWRVPYQIFSEILQISEKDWQLITRFSNFSLFWVFAEKRCKGCQYFSEIRRISENDWQPIQRFSENVQQQHKLIYKKVVNPSQRFYESPRRFGMKRTKT